MNLDVKAISTSTQAVDDATKAIEKSLNSKWDDAVHASFYGLVDDLRSTNKEFSAIGQRIEAVAVSVGEVDIKALKARLKSFQPSTFEE